MKSHLDLRRLFHNYWTDTTRKHVLIEAAPLSLPNDATTLFISSGMQPLVPYLAGQPHPQGTRLTNIQPSIRTQDIDEVGDNRHTTFFEMMGNWSLGDYFKEEQLAWKWEFYTTILGLPKERLYVTVFEGNELVAKDEASASMWKKLGVAEDHIYYYGVEKNWWSRSGTPIHMPDGEIGGPDSEIFFEFTQVEHKPEFGKTCHPNCDCGRFMEFGNSVFIEYRKVDGALLELPQKNVDFGGGLERTLAVWNDNPDIFSIDIFQTIIKEVQKLTQKSYDDEQYKGHIRIIADHIRAATFLIAGGVLPSNKEHGYVLRKLLRRSVVKAWQLGAGLNPIFDAIIDHGVLRIYDEATLLNRDNERDLILNTVKQELDRFGASMERGLKIIDKATDINGKMAFDLYQNYGFPVEVTEELAKQKNIHIDKKEFFKELNAHKELSKTTSAGKFKGGLVDESEMVVKYHTITHLLHRALRDVFGDIIRQEGSNITQERLRFDTRLDHKPTDEEIKQVENIINNHIDMALPVYALTMTKQEAENLGAHAFFKEKYGDKVQVYCIGSTPNNPSSAYSKELCGGPHVGNTSELTHVRIVKVKSIGSETVRFYVV